MSSANRLAEALGWLAKSVEADRVANAYVVVGDPRGEARDFAIGVIRLLFGEKGAANPEAHPDVLWVEPQKKSRVIGIDQIRDDVRPRMSQTAFLGGWKACIIVSADRLRDEAANAFLKTLEEPAGKSVFLLLTNQPEALLPTVASRCQRIPLGAAYGELPAKWSRPVMELLCMTAGNGAIAGRTMSRGLRDLLEQIKDEVVSEMKDEKSEDDDDETFEARVEARYRERRTAVMRLVVNWYRDIFVCSWGAGEAGLAFPKMADSIMKAAASVSPLASMRRIDIVEGMKDQFEKNFGEATVLGVGFARLSLD